MTAKNKQENKTLSVTKEAEEALIKVRSSVSRLVDDLHAVRTEMAQFKEAVSSDIQRLVDLRQKDINEIRDQFAKR